jgi:amino acid transporter
MGNPILALIVSLAWVLQCALVITPLTVATSRHIFAWSFDRVIPAKFSEVSERIGSPVYAVATVSVVIIVGYIFTLATTYLNFAVAAPMGVMFAFEFVAIATIVFKWRRKEIYNFSTLRDLKFLGIPLQPLIGVLSLITLAVMIGYYFGPLNGLVLGGLALPVTEISAGLVVAGVVLYYVSQAIQQRRGVSVALAFKEIPPE